MNKQAFVWLMLRALKIPLMRCTKDTTQKKVSGIKRHIIVDTQGLPHAIAITTANITDRAGTLEAFKNNKSTLSKVQSVLVAILASTFASATKEILRASVRVAKRSELHTFAVIPQRWVVERSFAWLEG